MTSIIAYSPEAINLIGENITAELSPDIIKSLMEIKVNNKFIRRRSPIKLKYTMNKSTVETWRKEKTGMASSKSLDDKFIEQINSELNKLSESNFDIIYKTIKTILENNNDLKFMKIALETLFNKSINEANFSYLYARLVKLFVEIYGKDFENELIDRVNKFYDNNIEKKFNISQDDIDYDELCRINKEKQKLLGTFTFIGGLYINNYINDVVILKYFNILINSIIENKDTDNNLDKYIECICTLITTIGFKLENSLKSDFDDIIISKLKEISNDRKKFKPRIRFMILDLLDLRQNNWKKK